MSFNFLNIHKKEFSSFAKSVQSGRAAHAILLSGIEGVGLMPLAQEMAAYILCQNKESSASCGECKSCRKIEHNVSVSLLYLFPYTSAKSGKSAGCDEYRAAFLNQQKTNPYMTVGDWAASMDAENKQLTIPVHEIRNLTRQLSLKALEGNRVVLIWACDKMNSAAANALLKLLEEPPENTHFILCTSQLRQIMPTILSRCQLLKLKRVPKEFISEYIQYDLHKSPEESWQLASIADGSLSCARELATQTQNTFSSSYMEWMRQCYMGNVEALQSWTNSIKTENREYHKLFLSFALQKTRDAMLYMCTVPELALATQSEEKFLTGFSKQLNPASLNKITDLLEEALYHITRNANVSMVFTNLSMNIHRILRTQK